MTRFGIGAVLLLAAACGREESRTTPAGSVPRQEPSISTWLEVQVRDDLTGAPVERCDIVGWQSERQMTEVTPAEDADDIAADGLHRFPFHSLAGRVRLAAPGYSETWSQEFKISAGETKRLTVSMKPLSRLVVTVLEMDGSPVKEGALLLTGPDRLSTMQVKNGVADGEEDAGSILVGVDPEFLEGYVAQQRPVTLLPGQRSDLTLHVARRPSSPPR